MYYVSRVCIPHVEPKAVMLSRLHGLFPQTLGDLTHDSEITFIFLLEIHCFDCKQRRRNAHTHADTPPS